MLEFKTIKEQTSMIVETMNSLILLVAYDGRSSIKIRFRKIENTQNNFFIEITCNQNVKQERIVLDFNPFRFYCWFYIKNRIKHKLKFPKCKKSRYGGFTFYSYPTK